MNKIKIMTKQVISYSFGRQVRLLALAVLFLAPFWAWGQTDYSGVYYIMQVHLPTTSTFAPRKDGAIMLQTMTLRALTMGILSSPRINAEEQAVTMKGRQYGPSKKLLILIIITSSKPALENIYFPMAKFARLMSIVCVYTLKQFLVISMTKHCLP